MRFAVASVTVLFFAGAAVFSWQRSQIVNLRAQVARQGDVLEDLSLRAGMGSRGATPVLHPARASLRAQATRESYDERAEMRADERSIIVEQYRDVMAQLSLSPEMSARLLDLLTERIETVLDAQDAAIRVGFAEGSAQAARAVSLAVAEVDRDIVALVGQDGIRRIDGLPAATGAPAVAPMAAPPVYVTVVVQAPPAPSSAGVADSGSQQAGADAGAQYVSYPYPYFPLYPISAVLNEPRGPRHFTNPRNGDEPRRRESVRYNYR